MTVPEQGSGVRGRALASVDPSLNAANAVDFFTSSISNRRRRRLFELSSGFSGRLISDEERDPESRGFIGVLCAAINLHFSHFGPVGSSSGE